MIASKKVKKAEHLSDSDRCSRNVEQGMDARKKKFYNSRRWNEKRKKILARDKYMCVECRKYGRIKPADVVHHIKEIEDNPELALDDNNLESLCHSCHNKAHPKKGGSRVRR